MKITHLLIGLFLLASILVIAVKPASVFAVTVNETNATASVTVNSAVDVSLTNTTIDFGSLDPGATNTANTYNPLRVTVNTNTNTQTNLSMKGTGDFSDGGSNSFGLGNLTYNNISSQTGERSMTTAYSSPPEFGDWINIPEPTESAEIRDCWFWIDIPSGQSAASYTTKVSIKTGVFS
jgi:hypothetical protein